MDNPDTIEERENAHRSNVFHNEYITNENNPAYEIAKETAGHEREGHEYWCINDMIHHGKKCQRGAVPEDE